MNTPPTKEKDFPSVYPEPIHKAIESVHNNLGTMNRIAGHAVEVSGDILMTATSIAFDNAKKMMQLFNPAKDNTEASDSVNS